MEEVFRAPAAVLAAIGPDDAGKTAAAHAYQRANCLAYAALEGALLGKDAAPVVDNGEELGEQAHRTSGRSAKVFFSGRRNRSLRATFLVREETRLSRSTVTPNWD